MKNPFELLMLGPDVNTDVNTDVCALTSVWGTCSLMTSPKRNELWDPLGAEVGTPGGYGPWGPRRAGRDLKKGRGPDDVGECAPGKPLTGLHRTHPSWLSLLPGAFTRPFLGPWALSLPRPSTCPCQRHPGPPWNGLGEDHAGSGEGHAVCWQTHRLPGVPWATCAFFFRKTCG